MFGSCESTANYAGIFFECLDICVIIHLQIFADQKCLDEIDTLQAYPKRDRDQVGQKQEPGTQVLEDEQTLAPVVGMILIQSNVICSIVQLDGAVLIEKCRCDILRAQIVIEIIRVILIHLVSLCLVVDKVHAPHGSINTYQQLEQNDSNCDLIVSSILELTEFDLFISLGCIVFDDFHIVSGEHNDSIDNLSLSDGGTS